MCVADTVACLSPHLLHMRWQQPLGSVRGVRCRGFIRGVWVLVCMCFLPQHADQLARGFRGDFLSMRRAYVHVDV